MSDNAVPTPAMQHTDCAETTRLESHFENPLIMKKQADRERPVTWKLAGHRSFIPITSQHRHRVARLPTNEGRQLLCAVMNARVAAALCRHPDQGL